MKKTFPMITVVVRRRLPTGHVSKKTIPKRKIDPKEITTFHYEGGK